MNIPLEQLKLAFPHKFPLYQTLLHNANASYTYLPEGSISLPERPIVKRFAEFCRSYFKNNVLDVGIGPMPVPGYYQGAEGFNLIGIDVIEFTDMSHTLEACAEFMPFPDEFFMAVVFGTSLDHVCDVARSLKETYRVLEPKGNVLVWMGDISHVSPRHGIVEIKGIYFCIPPGADDPFHMRRDSTETVIGQFEYAGFTLAENINETGNSVFLRFKK